MKNFKKEVREKKSLESAELEQQKTLTANRHTREIVFQNFMKS